MSQRISPSCHILEMFMPYLRDEKRLLDVLEKVAAVTYIEPPDPAPSRLVPE